MTTTTKGRSKKRKAAARPKKPSDTPTFEYVFAAIRGVQAGREYYVSMVPLRLLPKIFRFDEDEVPPELRAQRNLTKARVPKIARYMLENPRSYVFSSLTASIDSELRFEPLTENNDRLGELHIPLDARFIINDGQHRRAAIEYALAENSDFDHESISVVFFLDIGLERSQQIFADLNRNAARPSKTIGILYDHRDPMAIIVKRVVLASPLLGKLVELERPTPTARSQRLFALGSLYAGTEALLAGYDESSLDENVARASEFWGEVAKLFPEWDKVQRGTLAAREVRQDYLHVHGIALHAIGRIGNTLIAEKNWKRKLRPLNELDWSRGSSLWENRAVIGGRICKAGGNLTLTVNVLKRQLGLALSAEESELEDMVTKSA